MHVAELWRFPVKSMAGEPLGRADVRPDGIVGWRVREDDQVGICVSFVM